MSQNADAKANEPKSIPGGLIGLFASSSALLLLFAAVPVAGLAVLFFPPAAILLLIAFAVIGGSGLLVAARYFRRSPRLLFGTLTISLLLVAPCPEFNADPLTFAGGMALTFPFVFVVGHFFQWVRLP